MSILEGWEQPNMKVYNCHNIIDAACIRVASQEQKEEYPYVISLVNQLVYYLPDYSDLKPDIREWLDKRADRYYQPHRCAVLMFKDKNDVMEFKLRWG